MTRRAYLLLAGLCLSALTPALAQECTDTVQVGLFEVTYEGAAFDGVATELTYCITGLGGDGFKALSNWGMSLDQDCITDGNVTSCSTGDCYYQVDDPNLDLTGIKLDEEEIEAGETKCYSYSLEGDWTGLIGPTEVAIKAGTDVHHGEICGPICRTCRAGMAVSFDADGQPTLSVEVVHNRPPVVVTNVNYRLVNAAGERLHSWFEGPHTFYLGSSYAFDGPLPVNVAPGGTYTVIMRLRGMSGWIERSIEFTTPAP